MDKLKPDYNILKIAYSSLGLKHTQEIKDVMRKLALGRIISKETRTSISAAKIGYKGHIVKMVDNTTGIAEEFLSINQAAKHFGVHSEKVRRCILNKTLFLKRYIVTTKENSSE
jgi:hypothetical protein